MNGPLPLALSEILCVAGLYGYSSTEGEYAFLRAIQAVDNFYLVEESAKLKRSQKS